MKLIAFSFLLLLPSCSTYAVHAKKNKTSTAPTHAYAATKNDMRIITSNNDNVWLMPNSLLNAIKGGTIIGIPISIVSDTLALPFNRSTSSSAAVENPLHSE